MGATTRHSRLEIRGVAYNDTSIWFAAARVALLLGSGVAGEVTRGQRSERDKFASESPKAQKPGRAVFCPCCNVN